MGDSTVEWNLRIKDIYVYLVRYTVTLLAAHAPWVN